MRHALIDVAAGKVVNIVEIVPGDGSTAPDGFLHVASETAAIGDAWNGAEIVPAPPAPAPKLSADEQLGAVRRIRAGLMAASDVVALRCLKAGASFPTEWEAYTQALRDVTKQPDLFNVSWPTAPAVPAGV